MLEGKEYPQGESKRSDDAPRAIQLMRPGEAKEQ